MDAAVLIEREPFFTKVTFQYYQNGQKAFDANDSLSAAVWGAVFTEALLKDILAELAVPHEGDDLNQLIKKVKAAGKNAGEKALARDNKRYVDIAGRCNEIRIKRNRIVHDTGVSKGNIDADARDIYENNIEHIISQYVQTGVAHAIEKNNRQSQQEEQLRTPNFPVFISTITPHTFEQDLFIKSFCKRLEEIGISPKRCEFDEFDKKDPMAKVKREIAACNAVVVIGLERCHAYYFKEKEGSQIETEGIHRVFSSGWLQIESGIAVGLGKQVFVLCQEDIHSDGIFDRGWNSYTPIEMKGPLDVYNPQVELMLDKLKKFMEDYPER